MQAEEIIFREVELLSRPAPYRPAIIRALAIVVLFFGVLLARAV
jgi:hypothetical protein